MTNFYNKLFKTLYRYRIETIQTKPDGSQYTQFNYYDPLTWEKIKGWYIKAVNCAVFEEYV